MNKKLVIGIVSVLALGGGLLVWSSVSKKKKEKRESDIQKRIDDAVKTANSSSEAKLIEANIRANAAKEEAVDKILEDVGNVTVGKFAYPKDSVVNVRSSAKVDNGAFDNIIYEDYKKKVGLVTAVVASEEYGDKKKWYKVKLTEPDTNIITPDHYYGYVREDAITLKNA
jgi:hypothetical protein